MSEYTPQLPAPRSLREKIMRAVILILCAVMIVLLLNQGPWSRSAISRYDGVQGYGEKSWTFYKEDQILEQNLELPAFRHLETGTRYAISTRLTYDGSKDRIPCCLFFVDHMFCEAYLDGQQLFRYTEEEADKPDRSRSPGNVYSSFQLPPDCMGKELTVVFIPALSSNVEYQLPNPTCGDYFSEAVAMFRADLPQNIVSVLFAFMGIASVVFSTLVLPASKYREGVFIGIFAILVSCYSLTESDFDFYVISNPYYTYVLDYTAFSLIPIFLMAFLRERLDPEQRPLALAMILMGCGMFLTEMVLHFTGLVDMREFLPVIHVVYIVDFLLFFVLLLRMKKNRWKKQLVLQMVPVLIGMLLDAAVYYQHWELGTSDATFTSMGIFVFLVAELYHVWKYSIEVFTLSTQSREYMQMAYIDALTGIGNRRAFDAEKIVITSGRRKFKSILIASADLNDLKTTNDQLGHAAGDFLIRSAAEVLSDLTENRCHAFRMGGDEFTVLIYDMEAEEFEYCLQAMDRRIQAINSRSEVKLSMALGYEVIHSRDVDGAMASADKKMYENKEKIKRMRAMKV